MTVWSPLDGDVLNDDLGRRQHADEHEDGVFAKDDVDGAVVMDRGFVRWRHEVPSGGVHGREHTEFDGFRVDVVREEFTQVELDGHLEQTHILIGSVRRLKTKRMQHQGRFAVPNTVIEAKLREAHFVS